MVKLIKFFVKLERETKKIKYLKGSVRKANEKGVLREYLLYLKLKSITPSNGILSKSDILQFLRTQTTYSSHYYILNKLQQVNFIRHIKGTTLYTITSYVKVWRYLGCKPRYKDGKLLPYTYLIINSIKKDNKQWEALIYYLELQSIRHRIVYKKKLNLVSLLGYYFRTRWKHRGRYEKIRQLLLQIRSKDLAKDIAISCKRLSTLLGGRSDMFGLYVQRLLQNMGYLVINTRKKIHSTVLKYHYKMFGRYYYQPCNILTLTPQQESIFIDPNNQNLVSQLFDKCYSKVWHWGCYVG